MTYAKVVNGALIEAPKNYKARGWSFDFKLYYLDADLMKEHGFKPVKKK